MIYKVLDYRNDCDSIEVEAWEGVWVTAIEQRGNRSEAVIQLDKRGAQKLIYALQMAIKDMDSGTEPRDA